MSFAAGVKAAGVMETPESRETVLSCKLHILPVISQALASGSIIKLYDSFIRNCYMLILEKPSQSGRERFESDKTRFITV